MSHYPRLHRRALALIACVLAILSSARAQNAGDEVVRLISTANLGKPPVLWFASDPKINRGSGPKTWSAQSGGQFAVRGADAWGRPSAAFGLADDAKGGVAVSGSTTQSPINSQAGTVLFFCRPGAKSAPPMLLFSRADWGKPNYLSLRVNEIAGRWEITLAVADSRTTTKATQSNFATLKPGSWTFVALTWQESGGLCQFRYWAGDLATGELTEGELSTPTLDPSPGIFMLGGRRADDVAKYNTAPLLFSDGLLSHFTIYDAALGEDTVKALYLAATRR